MEGTEGSLSPAVPGWFTCPVPAEPSLCHVCCLLQALGTQDQERGMQAPGLREEQGEDGRWPKLKPPGGHWHLPGP